MCPRGTLARFLEQQEPFSHIERDVAIRFDLFLEVGEPCAEPIGPRFDRELVECVVSEWKLGLEAIVADMHERGLGERFVSLLAPPDDRPKSAMPIAEDVSLDAARLARDSLGRVATAVDAGGDRLDEDVSMHQLRLAKGGWREGQSASRRVKKSIRTRPAGRARSGRLSALE